MLKPVYSEHVLVSSEHSASIRCTPSKRTFNVLNFVIVIVVCVKSHKCNLQTDPIQDSFNVSTANAIFKENMNCQSSQR